MEAGSEVNVFWDKPNISSACMFPMNAGTEVNMFWDKPNHSSTCRFPMDSGKEVKVFWDKSNHSIACRFPMDSGSEVIWLPCTSNLLTRFLSQRITSGSVHGSCVSFQGRCAARNMSRKASSSCGGRVACTGNAMLVPVHSQSQRHHMCFSKSVKYQNWFGTEILVNDRSYLYDLYAIGVCLVIHLISEHHKIELDLFFSRFDASKHRAELQPKCIQRPAPSRV